MTCLTVPYVSYLSAKEHDVRKNVFQMKRVFDFCLQILSEAFLHPEKIQRNIIINLFRFSCKVPDIYIRFKKHEH